MFSHSFIYIFCSLVQVHLQFGELIEVFEGAGFATLVAGLVGE